MSQYLVNPASYAARSLANVKGALSAREVVSRVARRHGLNVRDLLPMTKSGKAHPHHDVLIEAAREALAAKFLQKDIAAALGRKPLSFRSWLALHGLIEPTPPPNE